MREALYDRCMDDIACIDFRSKGGGSVTGGGRAGSRASETKRFLASLRRTAERSGQSTFSTGELFSLANDINLQVIQQGRASCHERDRNKFRGNGIEPDQDTMNGSDAWRCCIIDPPHSICLCLTRPPLRPPPHQVKDIGAFIHQLNEEGDLLKAGGGTYKVRGLNPSSQMSSQAGPSQAGGRGPAGTPQSWAATQGGFSQGTGVQQRRSRQAAKDGFGECDVQDDEPEGFFDLL